jgi:hypothetical protein
LLGSNLGPDDLGQLIEVIDNNDSVIWQILASDVVDAIPRMIDNVHDEVEYIESESIFTDFISTVERLAQRIGYDKQAVALARQAIEQRIEELSGKAASEVELSVTGDGAGLTDVFDDRELGNLFAPLVWSEG